MDYKEFSKKELVDILDLTEYSLKCKREAEIKLLLSKVRRIIGGDYHVLGIGRGNGKMLTTPPMAIFSNYESEWQQIYGQEQYFYTDPIVLQVFKNQGGYNWDGVLKEYADVTPREFISRASDFNLRYGVAGGYYDMETGIATQFSVANNTEKYSSHQTELCSVLAPYLHRTMLRNMDDFQAKEALPPLSEREVEVLKWLKAGKTMWETGCILSISHGTVKYHLQNIKGKLNASNKMQALVIASEYGMI